MVAHHNGIVNHKIQRDGDACQRIQLHLQSERIIKNNGYRYIDGQADYNQKQIFGTESNQQYKQKQNGHRHSRTQINLVQFFLNKLRRVITGVNLIPRRKQRPDTIHIRFHFLAQCQLVSRFFRHDRQVNRIQPVNPVIALRLLFHTGNLYQLIQADDSSVFHLYLYSCRIKSTAFQCEVFVFRFGNQCQTYPLPVRSTLLYIISTHELFLIMQPDRLADIIRTYPECTQLFGVILQPPLHRGGTAKVNLINPRKLCQACFYMFFRVLLNQYRRSGRIDCERHERRLAALSRTLHLNTGLNTKYGMNDV